MNALTGPGGLLNPSIDSPWGFVVLCGVVYMAFRAIRNRRRKL